MQILAIETSCDETGLTILEAKGGLDSFKFKVLHEAVSSQIAIHREFGGVVPNLAKREHQKNLPILFEQIPAKLLRNIDLIAVTVGPGLEPALWVGITFAQVIHSFYLKKTETNQQFLSVLGKLQKNITKIKKIPVLAGVNHLEGHLYSFLLSNYDLRDVFPIISLIISGGHTLLLIMNSLEEWKIIGETRDDAVGEAFDKVARMLELPYPGGPEIEKTAKSGSTKGLSFPSPMLYSSDYDFSFSGLKTSVLYALKKNPELLKKKQDVAAAFQEATGSVLIRKTFRAVEEFGAKSVSISGGVAANGYLREAFTKAAEEYGVRLLTAETRYNGDNATIIGVAAYLNTLSGKSYALEAQGDLGM